MIQLIIKNLFLIFIPHLGKNLPIHKDHIGVSPQCGQLSVNLAEWSQNKAISRTSMQDEKVKKGAL